MEIVAHQLTFISKGVGMFLIIFCCGLSQAISLKMRKAYPQQNMLLDMCLRTTFVDKFCIVCQNLTICKPFCFMKI